MDTHIDGRPSGPTAEDIENRKKLMQAQALRQRTHRPNRLDAKQEKELQERYRRAILSQLERDIEDGIKDPPPCSTCLAENDHPAPLRAKGLCMRHYQRKRRAKRFHA